MAWIFLAVASLFEVLFATSMKAADGFSNLPASAATLAGVIGGITFLTLALKSMPVSVGYPVWVGVGAIGTVAVGHLLFGESLNPVKLGSVALILLGVIGLKLGGGEV